MSPAARRPLPSRIAHQADRAGRGARLLAARVDPRPHALPDFVVVGAQKAGTSSLYGQLAAHPSVIPALRKEVHFFDRPRAPLARYRDWFPTVDALARVAARTGRGITGEATPYYLCHPAVPRRLREAVPEVRVIAVLRDPVGRAVSGYHHAVRVGDERRPIEVALDPSAAEDLPPASAVAWYDDPRSPLRLHGYLARGRYAEQLERWFAVFPREHLLVLDSHELRAGRIPDAVRTFLDLPPGDGAVVADRNVGAYASPDPGVEATLREYFRPHNARLVSLLGVELPWAT
jgi:hypothetical protein